MPLCSVRVTAPLTSNSHTILPPLTVLPSSYPSQCFEALRHMHESELVHRDMKPANLLLNAACLMKVCDFGLARSVAGWHEGGSSDRDALMTDYVATRW